MEAGDTAWERMPNAWRRMNERIQKVQDRASKLLQMTASELEETFSSLLKPTVPDFLDDSSENIVGHNRVDSDIQKIKRLVIDIEEHPAFETSVVLKDMNLLLVKILLAHKDAASALHSPEIDASRLQEKVDLALAVSPRQVFKDLRDEGHISFTEYAGLVLESELSGHLWMINDAISKLEVMLKIE